jgi:hypothetical protein
MSAIPLLDWGYKDNSDQQFVPPFIFWEWEGALEDSQH